MSLTDQISESPIKEESSSIQDSIEKTKKPRLKRNRAQLSCDRCRKLKRKCNRDHPCEECMNNSIPCTYERRKETTQALEKGREKRKRSSDRASSADSPSENQSRKQSLKSPHPGFSPGSLNWPKRSTQSDLTPTSTSGASASTSATTPPEVPLSLNRSSLDSLYQEPAFLERIVQLWSREIDWMHTITKGTPFERLMLKNLPMIYSGNQELYAKFQGVLYALTALCCLVVPSDVEGILVYTSTVTTRHGFNSAEVLGHVAYNCTSQWLDDHTKSVPAHEWDAEAFQTAMIYGMYIKYTGNWNFYREITSRDMDRLQRAGYHKLLEMCLDKSLSEDEIVARYCIFWRYFTVDRISSLFDGVPYVIQARNANTWLFIPGKIPLHIRSLCRDSGTGEAPGTDDWKRIPLHMQTKLASTLPPFAHVQAQLGALAGRCADRLSALTATSIEENYIIAEHIAAETDDDLLSIESTMPLTGLSVYETPLIVMTMARIRRDITTRLSRHITKLHKANPGGDDACVRTLNRRTLNTAKSLIRRSTSTVGATPIRAISTPFFTLFVAETMVELLSSVEEFAGKSHPKGALDSESKDDLKYALIGRNFNAILQRNGEMHLNRLVTEKACQQCDATLRMCLPKSFYGEQESMKILNVDELCDIDYFIQACQSPRPKNQLENQPLQNAADVLNLFESLTSLQKLFDEMDQQDQMAMMAPPPFVVS